MIDKQITFDTIVTGLRKQNARSIDGQSCKFRSTNGLRCAIGFLIEDSEYTPDFDDPKKDDAGFTFVKNKGHNEVLLSALMIVHDHSEPKSWENQFKDIAKRFNLNYSV